MTARRFTVMGFTEAELGFVLAAVFAVLAVSGLSAQPRENLAAKNDTLSHRADSLARRADSVAAAFAAFRDSVHKKSNKIPRCSEKGESADAIAEFRILGRDAYDLRGERLTFHEVETRFAPQLARSAELGCRYLVRTIATRGVDGPDHSAAIGKLWARFDVSERQR
jgi:hypothetical protein